MAGSLGGITPRGSGWKLPRASACCASAAFQMDLYPDFKEFIQLLNAEQVEYLVGGGYAVTLHG